MEKTKRFKKAPRSLKLFQEILSRHFDLLSDKASNEEIIESMEQAVEFKGANLWILIFAILLASIGLNINSTAVIIGAMLISPLMGPIVGLGLGVATVDFDLMKRALRSFGFAVGTAILASTIYFLLTPLSDAKSELLARTSPTIWDVLIAFFGGIAGIIAYSRKIKTNVVPGVAIATALMPPLCTAGYGIANGSLAYSFGALYLFFINSVFICFATILISKLLHLPKKQYIDELVQKRMRQLIAVLVIVTALPSIYLTYRIVKNSIVERNANLFLTREFRFPDTQILDRKIHFDRNPPEIVLTLIGHALTADQIQQLQDQEEFYGLRGIKLVINQTLSSNENPEKLQTLKSEILTEFYKQSTESLRTKDEKIAVLEAELARLKSQALPEENLFQEARAQHPDLVQGSFARTNMIKDMQDKTKNGPILLAFLEFKRNPTNKDKERIKKWLSVRVGIDAIILQTSVKRSN